ncbi:hypothetical protein [Bradyrhizobium sp. BWC-3-1]|nr:hypothetical protein [Bradyrhizobium sp. BWC-3-1]WOH57841.1 hypothetical protein RX329_37900 [Bradyrhizobium sp. BWC-3-1]
MAHTEPPSIRADLALRNSVMRGCELVNLDLIEDGPPIVSRGVV